MQLERVGPYLWRIPQDPSRGMRVPGLVVADDHLIESIRSDASLEQLANGATLPGIVKATMAMPDIHQGYGLPVGGGVATDARQGVVSPGAIGFDINWVCACRPDGDPRRCALRRDPDGRWFARSTLTLDPRALDDVQGRERRRRRRSPIRHLDARRPTQAAGRDQGMMRRVVH
jgi:tRNA-splicing ligase RtcB